MMFHFPITYALDNRSRKSENPKYNQLEVSYSLIFWGLTKWISWFWSQVCMHSCVIVCVYACVCVYTYTGTHKNFEDYQKLRFSRIEFLSMSKWQAIGLVDCIVLKINIFKVLQTSTKFLSPKISCPTVPILCYFYDCFSITLCMREPDRFPGWINHLLHTYTQYSHNKKTIILQLTDLTVYSYM